MANRKWYIQGFNGTCRRIYHSFNEDSRSAVPHYQREDTIQLYAATIARNLNVINCSPRQTFRRSRASRVISRRRFPTYMCVCVCVRSLRTSITVKLDELPRNNLIAYSIKILKLSSLSPRFRTFMRICEFISVSLTVAVVVILLLQRVFVQFLLSVYLKIFMCFATPTCSTKIKSSLASSAL